MVAEVAAMGKFAYQRLLIALLWAWPVLAAPKAIVSCKAVNYPEEIVHNFADKHAVLEEVDNWVVSCTITLGADTIWTETLPLAHPTGYEEAMTAINKFRKEEAPKILKEKMKGKEPSK